MTICNVYPFGHDDQDSLTWSEYMTAMTHKKEQWPYERLKSIVPNLTVAEYDEVWADLFSHFGFATSLMLDFTDQLRAIQSQQLIVDCLLFDKGWNEHAAVDCKSTLRFYWDQSYQKCYTIHVPRNVTEVRTENDSLLLQ